MAAKITGKVVAVYVDEGMHVTQGQILAQLGRFGLSGVDGFDEGGSRRNARADS